MRVKRIAALCLIGLALAGALFAQAKATLTVIVSEGPAQILIDGRLVANANPKMWVQLVPGTYELLVKKAGKPDWKQKVVLPAEGVTINVNLSGTPAPVVVKPTFTLSVTANAPGAQVSVNGTGLGAAPASASVEAGNYKIDVTAAGYEPYTATVAVAANTTHAAVLKASTYRLTVNATPAGAIVFLNDTKAGVAPLAIDLQPGNYNLKVSAPGYIDYLAPLALAAAQTVSVALQPSLATVEMVIGPELLNKQIGKPESLVDVYLDGVKQKGLILQIPAGDHKLAVVSGGLSIEGNVKLEAGKSYRIALVGNLTFK